MNGAACLGPRAALAGITLVEILAITALVAILVCSAAGMLQSLWRRWALQQAAQLWVSDMNAARYHAVAKSLLVTVCPSVDGQRCAPEQGWSVGWIVFEDGDGDGRRSVPHEVLLRQRPASRVWARSQLRGAVTVGRYVMYTPQGRSRLHTGAFQAGSLVACDDSGRFGMRLVMNAAGRWRQEALSAGECS
ncbi:GspH/FimT family pseudopilin [Tepidimonas taiwanensis]|nr:GspH/FimT family pseudopilin [Tepidimonas taiwanensis]UBQ04622.1 GspH/FimT family pseudopilin [Tepidimonas taiwanensis]